MSIMKKSNYASSLIAFAIVFLPISAYSVAIPDRGPIPFAAYDKDGNGLISEKEFSAVHAERMSTGTTEGRPMRGATSAPSFSEFDTNKDGQLTQDELVAGQKAQMEKRRSMGMGMGQGRGMGEGMGMGRNMPTFSEYDLDGNGKILEKEFNEARSKRISANAQQGYQMRNIGNAPSFTDIDVNENGEISPEEFTEHQASRRGTGATINALSTDSASSYDPRKLVSMPENARALMRKDMQANLSALNAIIGYLASKDFQAAADAAEEVMGKSAMGKHRGSGAAPGWFMSNEMRMLGWNMHEAASGFSEIAKKGDIQDALKALERITSLCAACHFTYRTQ